MFIYANRGEPGKDVCWTFGQTVFFAFGHIMFSSYFLVLVVPFSNFSLRVAILTYGVLLVIHFPLTGLTL